MHEGDLLAGRYRIGRRLGRGSMGAVLAAEHLLLKEAVAIKFMTGDRCQDEDAVARFLQEARAVRRIQSEHVVRVLDVAVRDDGVPYIVMEYLEGVDLAAKVARVSRVPVQDAASWVIQACDGVAAAHRMGIVHRDLKPANLFLLDVAGRSTIKVLDFGISKNTRVAAATADVGDTERSAGLTQARALLGSPSYMAPEQMDSARDADARSDVWSLGVTLFELVTGELPFAGQSVLQIYKNILSSDPEELRRRLARFPEGLTSAIRRCLALDPDDRFPTTGALAVALAPLATPEAAALAQRIMAAEKAPTIVTLDEAPVPSSAPQTAPAATGNGRWRGNGMVGGFTLFALVGLTFGGFAVAGRLPRSIEASQSAAAAVVAKPSTTSLEPSPLASVAANGPPIEADRSTEPSSSEAVQARDPAPVAARALAEGPERRSPALAAGRRSPAAAAPGTEPVPAPALTQAPDPPVPTPAASIDYEELFGTQR